MRRYLIGLFWISLLFSCDDRYKEFYDNGQLKMVGQKVNGLKEGTWVIFTNKGDTAEIQEFVMDTLKSKLIYVKMNPYVKEVFSDNGKKKCLTVFYEDGTIESEKCLFNNKLEGEALSYFEDGSIKTTSTFKEGNPIGEFVQYHPNGKQYVYTKDIVNGVYEIYDSMGNKTHDLLYENYKLKDTLQVY